MSGNTNSDIWIAGAFAAFSVDLLVYPLDTLKTRMQSPDYKKLYVNQTSNTIKTSVLFRGLYQGLGSVILATLPSSGAFFTTYEGSKSVLSRLNPSNPFVSAEHGGRPALIPQPLVHSAASAIAECVSCAILTPAEVIKQNTQMVSKESVARTGSSPTMQTLKRFRSNPFALWRGYGALVGRNLPFTALQFPLFERFKEGLRRWRDEKRGGSTEVPLWEHGAITALAAGTAGAIAAVVTTPVDVIKTRIMLAAATNIDSQPDKAKATFGALKDGQVADALGKVKDDAPKKRKSSWAVGKEVVRDQGWKGLMRGGALRGVWTMLAMGLYLSVYEAGRLYLERRRERRENE